MVNSAAILLFVVVISLQNFDVNGQSLNRKQILSQYGKLWDPRLRYRTTTSTTTEVPLFRTETPLFRTENSPAEFAFFN